MGFLGRGSSVGPGPMLVMVLYVQHQHDGI